MNNKQQHPECPKGHDDFFISEMMLKDSYQIDVAEWVPVQLLKGQERQRCANAAIAHFYRVAHDLRKEHKELAPKESSYNHYDPGPQMLSVEIQIRHAVVAADAWLSWLDEGLGKEKS